MKQPAIEPVAIERVACQTYQLKFSEDLLRNVLGQAFKIVAFTLTDKKLGNQIEVQPLSNVATEPYGFREEWQEVQENAISLFQDLSNEGKDELAKEKREGNKGEN